MTDTPVPSKDVISLDEVRKLYERIQHVYDDALIPVEAGVVKRLCAEVCGLSKALECATHEPPAELDEATAAAVASALDYADSMLYDTPANASLKRLANEVRRLRASQPPPDALPADVWRALALEPTESAIFQTARAAARFALGATSTKDAG